MPFSWVLLTVELAAAPAASAAFPGGRAVVAPERPLLTVFLAVAPVLLLVRAVLRFGAFGLLDADELVALAREDFEAPEELRPDSFEFAFSSVMFCA